MLTDEEKLYLIERLATYVGELDKPRETLVAPFLATTIGQSLAAGTPQQMVIDCVRMCQADGWRHDPPWLVLLIEIMPVDVVDNKLAQVRDRLRVKPPAGPDPLLATVLDNGTPFVNRQPLRRHLSRLVTPAANLKPILVLRGGAKSGKSYSTEFIDHFSVHHTEATLACRVSLRAGAELETGPQEVAVELVRAMGRTLLDKPPANTNQKLLVQQLASWVLNEAVHTNKQCWLLLDNFEGSHLRPDTRDFVVALADAVTTGIFRERCRLFLIGFDSSVLTVDPGRIGEERIAAPVKLDIETCVGEIVRRAPVPLNAAPLVAFVHDHLPNGEQRLREMNARLRCLILILDQVREIQQAIQELDVAAVVGKMLLDLPAGDGLLAEVDGRLAALRASAEELGQ